MLSGFDLQPRSSSHGPDIHLILDGENVWIEATAPSEGVGEDAVPTLDEHSGYVPVPEDNVILRYSSSISEKMQRLDNYIETSIVGPNDFYIIAINGARIEMSLLDGPIPAIVRAVYPIGDQQVTIDKNKMEVIEERYATRRTIRKHLALPFLRRVSLIQHTPGYPAYSMGERQYRYIWEMLGKICCMFTIMLPIIGWKLDG